jgi:hypothetical protein
VDEPRLGLGMIIGSLSNINQVPDVCFMLLLEADDAWLFNAGTWCLRLDD